MFLKYKECNTNEFVAVIRQLLKFKCPETERMILSKFIKKLDEEIIICNNRIKELMEEYAEKGEELAAKIVELSNCDSGVKATLPYEFVSRSDWSVEEFNLLKPAIYNLPDHLKDESDQKKEEGSETEKKEEVQSESSETVA